MAIPRCIISGLSGGAGKTMLSLGLARAFARSGIRVRTFKKGPDYIDAAWLSLAGGSPQANLDPFFTPGPKLLRLFLEAATGYDMALIEGNRGLFDGLDLEGSCSTAEVARILGAPVLLVLDCTKMTRTVAAVVKGCLDFEPGVRIGGVILNRTGNERHRHMVQKAVEDLCGVPVLGVLPRRAEPFIIERHMGLAGADEHERISPLLDGLADFVEEHVDLEQIRVLSGTVPELNVPQTEELRPSPLELPDAEAGARNVKRTDVVIGYIRDAAFWFYYQENLAALERSGAKLLPLSLLSPAPWPEIHGLYIGGGLPELYARELSANTGIREHVANLARTGLPVYAECGGFMYLAESLETEGEAYRMAGVFPVDVCFHTRPQGLGYVEATIGRENPFHPVGTVLRGHEFHFSGIRFVGGPAAFSADTDPVFVLTRGTGMAADHTGRRRDGLLRFRTFASYTHIYAPCAEHWAPSFIAQSRDWLRQSG